MAADQPTDPGAARSALLRGILIALVTAGVLWVGHSAARMWRSNAAAPASPIRVEMGDRAGGDIADVPRPPRSERIGSMSGQAGSANVRYVTPAAPGEVVNFYLNTMPRRGWMPRVRTRPGDVEYPGTILWYSNAKGNSCMITVSDAGGQGTAVTIIRMARTAD